MKFNTLLKKTALAAAIATVSLGASAGVGSFKPADDKPVVLANEIFGTVDNTGSSVTTVQLPVMEFVAADLVGITLDGSALLEPTIKLTLGGGAVFAEDYSDSGRWGTQGLSVLVGGTSLSDTEAVVTAGGTATDNQITIKLIGATANALSATVNDAANTGIVLTGFKVKQLNTVLMRGANGKLEVALEVRENALNTASKFDNTARTPMVVSIDGVKLSGEATTYEAGGNRERINVADGQTTFTTKTGDLAASDFATGQPLVNLGKLTIERGENANGIEAKKEDGTLFDFSDDTLTLALKGSSDLLGYGKFFLASAADCSGTEVATGVPTAASPKDVNVVFASAPALGDTFSLCAQAEGTEKMAETNISATLNVKYFNTRYNESNDTENYGRILRNGCQVTLFNLPNVDAADNAFIRFTNTTEKSGEVTATIWGQDGSPLDQNVQILPELGKHATAVFHTNPAQPEGYLGDLLPEFKQSTGRSRIVLQGAFSSCEAMGLVRSANGTLVNMTSTVYSGPDVPATNGTSNTTN